MWQFVLHYDFTMRHKKLQILFNCFNFFDKDLTVLLLFPQKYLQARRLLAFFVLAFSAHPPKTRRRGR